MSGFVRETKLRLGVPLLLVAVMWVVELATIATQGALLGYGIHPRSQSGLIGILFSPFLHMGFPHLLANSIPFLVLGWLVALRGLREFFLVTLIVMILGGGAVWLLGRPFSNHVGASGVVFGYLGFLLARGFLERSAQAMSMSLLVILLYGGALWGLLSGSARISWEGHLFGFLAGIVAARLFRAPRVVPDDSFEDDFPIR